MTDNFHSVVWWLSKQVRIQYSGLAAQNSEDVDWFAFGGFRISQMKQKEFDVLAKEIEDYLLKPSLLRLLPIFALRSTGTTCCWTDATPRSLLIPTTPLSSTCLSRKSSNLILRKQSKSERDQHLFLLSSRLTGAPGTRWPVCMRMETVTTPASPSRRSDSSSSRMRQCRPTICTASPDSVTSVPAVTLRSVRSRKRTMKFSLLHYLTLKNLPYHY